MCLESFKLYLKDNFFRAIDNWAKDCQLDVVRGVDAISDQLCNEAYDTMTVTYESLGRKKTVSNEVCDKREFDEQVDKPVKKLETYKSPVIVLTFKD